MNYTNARLELYASAGGAPARTIRVNCAVIVWSPDSTKLACVDDNSDARQAVAPDPDRPASAATTTLATGFFDSQVSFSPDSTRLAYRSAADLGAYFTSRGKLKVIDLATRAITTVRAGVSWRPPGGLTRSRSAR